MQAKLIKKELEADIIKSFYWELDEKITYFAGQYFYYTLPNGEIHDFTNSLSPTESNLIRFTTKMRKESTWKRLADSLPLGTKITCKGPNGTFFMDETISGSHVFLAGGIGITPFRSMTKFALDKNLNININLVYSVSAKNEAAFLDEFQDWQKSHPNFVLNLLDTSQTGHLDKDQLQKLVSDIKNTTFWLCGPPPFVDAMEKILSQMKIKVDNIKSEKFEGY